MCKSDAAAIIPKTAPENGDGGEPNTIQIRKEEKGKKIHDWKILESINTYGSIINLKYDVKNLEQQSQIITRLACQSTDQTNWRQKIRDRHSLKRLWEFNQTVIAFGDGLELINKLRVLWFAWYL